MGVCLLLWRESVQSDRWRAPTSRVNLLRQGQRLRLFHHARPVPPAFVYCNFESLERLDYRRVDVQRLPHGLGELAVGLAGDAPVDRLFRDVVRPGRGSSYDWNVGPKDASARTVIGEDLWATLAKHGKESSLVRYLLAVGSTFSLKLAPEVPEVGNRNIRTAESAALELAGLRALPGEEVVRFGYHPGQRNVLKLSR